MKRSISSAVFVGMGALGLLYGGMMQDALGPDAVAFLMDEARRSRHEHDRYTINGNDVSFRMVTPAEMNGPADLLIFATKANGLSEARDLAEPLIGPDTTIVSLLNGIHSEGFLAERYPREQIIDTIVLGMDVVREGSGIVYSNTGRWQFGATMEAHKDRVDAIADFLERSGIQYEVCDDIRHAVWNKFMLNVGVNQTCMVYETGYGVANEGGQAVQDLYDAMHEVIAVAAAEGVTLTESDYEKNIALMNTLDPNGCPSMRQDAIAKRPSEVDIFAGTVIRLANAHGIAVPVNERYYRTIKEMESAY